MVGLGEALWPGTGSDYLAKGAGSILSSKGGVVELAPAGERRRAGAAVGARTEQAQLYVRAAPWLGGH